MILRSTQIVAASYQLRSMPHSIPRATHPWHNVAKYSRWDYRWNTAGTPHTYTHIKHPWQNVTNYSRWDYGVALISRLLKIIGLFCKRSLLKRTYSAKETHNFKEPTDRSHPIPVKHCSLCHSHFLAWHVRDRTLQTTLGGTTDETAGMPHTYSHITHPWQNVTKRYQLF